ncbi:MAG: TAT-variant-translocated molybdopterin oxidoreductase [Bacteroidota bacterium]
MEKKYWKGVEELRNEPEFVRLRDNEFFEHLPVDEVISKKATSTADTSRRDFLKFLGFSVAAASLAACQAPVKKAIPYVIKPEEITLGVPNYYASTFFDGQDYCSVVVKTREGRPIKVDGNELSSISKGGSNARVQASVLNLYDSERIKGPVASKKETTWAAADAEIIKKLGDASAAGKKIVILSSSIVSPSTKKVIADFTVKYPTTKQVVYDAVSYYGLLKGNEMAFGRFAIPSYRFDNADVIVGFNADFLSTWLSPVEFSRQYAATRKLCNGKKNMSRHIQFETNLSVTGSNADNRIKIRASEQSAAVALLYNKIAAMAGGAPVTVAALPIDKKIAAVAEELWNAKGKAIVVSGSNDPNEQVLINAINNMLGSYGSTMNLDQANLMKQSNDEGVAALINELNNGEVGAIIIYNTNPGYSMPALNAAIAKAGVKISLADREDETAATCDYICPDAHYLESWSDAEPVKGMFSLGQPTINPLFNTRQAQSSLLTWAGANADYHAYIQEFFRSNIYTLQTGMTSFDAFWNKTLQDGVFETGATATSTVAFAGNAQEAASKLQQPTNGVEVILYQKTGLGNGSQGNNPWLHELPDPVSKVCWDNYFAMLPDYAEKMGYKQGTVIEVKSGNVTLKGPVFFQPGTANETIAVAVGYGRTKVGKAGNNVGFNVYPLVGMLNGGMKYYASGVTVNKTVEEDYPLATTQTHHTMMGREIVKETTLAAWQKDQKAGNPAVEIETPYGKRKAEDVNLWATKEQPGHLKANHFWNMAIDLNACIGCGSCVVACNAENNVPVVGKDEIMRSREMHWIRIDRYYSSEVTKENAKEKGLGKLSMYAEMEKPSSDNPEVVFQPVMCQHCNHAPCETVCPVVATTHSMEGLNMMAYNRCVGTRYCANNCPYKVRRFNWFRYNENEQFPYNQFDNLGKMVLNPDVVVRSRGVMEKCTMCIQRIQYGKLEAKKDGRRPVDGEIKTACAQACPTNAIIFGDVLDEKSVATEEIKNPRSYHLLEEINTQPSVYYQTKVRNRQEENHV